MALVRASRDGDFSKVKEILNKNAESIDEADLFGETALHEAIYNGYDDISIYLLKHNASPNLCRADDNSPLHIASNKGRYFIAKLLLQNKIVRNNINQKNSLGNTALHAACKKTQVDLVKLLVDNGANVNCKNKRGQRPIDYTRDVRLYRILRGKKWYNDLEPEVMTKRIINGQQRQIESPNSNKKKNKKRRRRRGSRNKNKKNNDQDEELKTNHNQKNKKKQINNVSNKDLDNDLKTWLEFNDMISIERQQQYQCVYFNAKLKIKWIKYMRCLREKHLNIMEYNNKMCQFADGLYLEYSQPQFDCNHYKQKPLDEYDSD